MTLKWNKQRFETFFTKTESCWDWEGSLRGKGYGGFRQNNKMYIASRVSYELYKNPIPEGLLVCHTCNNPKCVNPNHLYLGTYQENTQQAVKEGRQYIPKGVENGSAKLTEEQIFLIREDPRSQRTIAKEYGISQLHVSRIKRKISWSHI